MATPEMEISWAFFSVFYIQCDPHGKLLFLTSTVAMFLGLETCRLLIYTTNSRPFCFLEKSFEKSDF